LDPKTGNNKNIEGIEAPPSEHNYTNHSYKFNLSLLDYIIL